MRYFIGVLVIIFLIVLGSILFIGRNRTPNVNTIPQPKVAADFTGNDGSRVVWTQLGKLVGDSEYFSVRITISASQRKIELLKGYQQKAVKSQTFSNNFEAYEQLLKALDNLDFTEQREVGVADDEGVCPTGKRYIYELFAEGQQELRSWSTSCTTKDGPYDGANAVTTRKLFQRQIAGYNNFIRGVEF